MAQQDFAQQTPGAKILIVDENSFVPLDVRVWSEARALRDAGWQPIIMCPMESNERPDASVSKESTLLEGIPVFRFPLEFAGKGMASYLREYVSAFLVITAQSWRIWRREHFDIIHFCNPPDIFFSLALVYRLLGVKVVFDHHDLFPELIGERYPSRIGHIFRAIALVCEYLTFRCANVVIATNESYRRIALTRGGVTPERTFVVRNGPGIHEFDSAVPDRSLKQGFPFLTCYVGVMGYEDGLQELIQVVRYVVHERKRADIRFAILGDGPERAEALDEIRAWHLEPFVEMPGMVRNRHLIHQYLVTADICLSPEPLTPLNSHSSFVKVGEYMAAAKPIVAFDLPETRFTAGEAAWFVSPGDIEGYGEAIIALVDSPDQRRRMGECGRGRFLNHLAWEHQIPKLFQAYWFALHGGPPGE